MQFSDEMHAYFTGSLWPVEKKKLVELANKSKGEFIIEIGVYRGHTTKYLLENTDKRVITIDPYQIENQDNESIKKEFLDNCGKYLENGRLIHINEYSVDSHRYFTPYIVNNCALVFIDWPANSEQHYKDFIDFTPYVAEDGYLAVHDFYDNGSDAKHKYISEAISMYMKNIDKSICWETILYYPKHSDMQNGFDAKNWDSTFFYNNRSRGLIWCSPNYKEDI
jgi:predicted O-methyltransferase YrrM